MSKKITHEHMKNLVSRTYNTLVYYFNDDNALKFEKEFQDYIKQQEQLELENDLKYTYDIKILGQKIGKQQKLLELHKELHDRYRYPTWKDNEEVKVILKQIKELENE